MFLSDIQRYLDKLPPHTTIFSYADHGQEELRAEGFMVCLEADIGLLDGEYLEWLQPSEVQDWSKVTGMCIG